MTALSKVSAAGVIARVVCLVLIAAAPGWTAAQSSSARATDAARGAASAQVELERAVATAKQYIAALVESDYATMYRLRDPSTIGRMSLDDFAAQERRLREKRGDLRGFEVGDAVWVWYFNVEVSNLTGGDDHSRSAGSLVGAVAGWVREDGGWRLNRPLWWNQLAQVLRHEPGVASAPREWNLSGGQWPRELQALPGCPDVEGLQLAIARLERAVVDRDHGAAYALLSRKARSEWSWADFDGGMRTLERNWLKPVRIVAADEPFLVVTTAIKFKPTQELRERLLKRRGAVGEFVTWRCGVVPVLIDGEWRVLHAN